MGASEHVNGDTRSPTGRRALLAGAIAGTAAMTLWMANREPFFLGPLWGTSIALATTLAWVAWLAPARAAEATPWREALRSAEHRPGLIAMILIAMLYLPLLGATGLWDPWETHYAEVAREILARNDWISLWWAQDKWFWSVRQTRGNPPSYRPSPTPSPRWPLTHSLPGKPRRA